MAATNLTAQSLREQLSYDKDTGIFRRLAKASRYSHINIGDVAGSMRNEYIVIKVFGKAYRAHRLAFLHVTGEWPKHEVDHINQVSTDNRWENLRDVPKSINLQNQRLTRKYNVSGFLGVYPSPARCLRKWSAHIYVTGSVIYLGTFTTKEEAHAAYVEAKRKHHPGYTL